MESINGSLRRLQTDYVDVYQAHRYDYQTPLEETMGAFADIVHAGKAHYIGVSEWTVEEIRAGAALAAELGIRFVSSQPQYNMLWRVIEPEVVPVCEELGITQVCWSPLAQGVLTGKYGSSTVPAGSRFSDDDGGLNTEHKFMQPEVLERVEKLKPIAQHLGVPLATLAVAWVLANPNVSAAIVGASRPEQLDDTVKAAELVLGREALELIDDTLGDVVERDPTKKFFTVCWYGGRVPICLCRRFSGPAACGTGSPSKPIFPTHWPKTCSRVNGPIEPQKAQESDTGQFSIPGTLLPRSARGVVAK